MNTVTVFIGPQGSGKTTAMRSIADQEGIEFRPLRFCNLPEISRNHFIRFHDWPRVKELIQKKILFIDEYDISNVLANNAIHQLAQGAGLRIIVGTQGPITTDLPNSFELHTCKVKEVPHAS